MNAERQIVMYGNRWCPYCNMAKRFLKRKGVSFEEVNVGRNDEQRRLMEQRSGRNTVPQVFVGEMHLGGYTDLKALDEAGELDDLLGLASE